MARLETKKDLKLAVSRIIKASQQREQLPSLAKSGAVAAPLSWTNETCQIRPQLRPDCHGPNAA
jgi:hypothetical protein